MRDIRDVKIADLLVDQANYRLPPQANQRDAIREMVRDQKRKLTVLGLDILTHGLSPSELLLASESTDQPGKFVVYEGNRRVTALKVMESPELALGLPTEQAFKRLGEQFKAKPIRSVDVCVVPDRETAMFWIQRRHTTGHNGAGVEGWGAMAQDRHDRDHDRPARRAIMAMELLEDGSDEWRRVSTRLEPRTTTVDRVLDMPYFEATLGVHFDTQEVVIEFENEDQQAGEDLLRRILTEMADPIFKFERVETADDRRTFIDSFSSYSVKKKDPTPADADTGTSDSTHEGKGDATPAAGAPDANSGQTGTGTQDTNSGSGAGSPTGSGESSGTTSGAGSASDTGSSAGSSTSGGRGTRKRKDPLQRDTLAPTKQPYLLRVSGLRMSKLYEECKALKVDKHRNAAAVLMRVFLELSTDQFIKIKGLPVPTGMAQNGKSWDDVKLKPKIEAVTAALDPRKVDRGLDSARSAGADFIHGIPTLHRYVHGLDYVPEPSELKATWERWHPYLHRLHETINPL